MVAKGRKGSKVVPNEGRIKMSRKRIEHVGEKLGYITIISERPGRGYRIFRMKCEVCGAEKEVAHSQYNSGNWNVCEHDAL